MKLKRTDDPFDTRPKGAVLSVRFVVSLLLVVLGIAWIVYYYVAMRADPFVADSKAGSPAFLADLERWNYVIGFGLFFLGLALSAHPSTPLGRGRGVVAGMLGCFIVGLLWICTFYVVADGKIDSIPVMNDLRQSNLVVGIAFMAVGFTFATRWE
ncbi:cell division protein CrgA [Nocardioides acrostichi]|uniref:Cell division protein CrgA n=1 Tax=Nocardioides acrostichi TaxID=2784339 RepID=A0A930V213_9ACTN|nr:cell division protein CrgA [Nocardioides acrostichi]MBF4163962.1 cell division protein CrgA [Nocardioides acrostichi]